MLFGSFRIRMCSGVGVWVASDCGLGYGCGSIGDAADQYVSYSSKILVYLIDSCVLCLIDLVVGLFWFC